MYFPQEAKVDLETLQFSCKMCDLFKCLMYLFTELVDHTRVTTAWFKPKWRRYKPQPKLPTENNYLTEAEPEMQLFTKITKYTL